MDFKGMLIDKIRLYDGSKGYLLMRGGLSQGDYPETWNLARPDAVYEIHKAYAEAGAEVLQTNTLQSSGFHLEAVGLYEKLREINRAGVLLAKRAADGKALVAASVGPLGRLMEPYGDLSFDSAFSVFSEYVGALIDGGTDLLHFETFTDLSELRAAILAARSLDPSIPIVATLSLERGGRTVAGDDAACSSLALDMLRVECVGANCGLPPAQMLSVFEPFSIAGLPLCAKPNAGLPVLSDGGAMYGSDEEEFYGAAFGFGSMGARLLGGCCGSGPSHIKRLKNAVDEMNADKKYAYAPLSGGQYKKEGGTVRVCSYDHYTDINIEKMVKSLKRFQKAANTENVKGKPIFYADALSDDDIIAVDLSSLRADKATLNDAAVDILAELSDSDAGASVICLNAGPEMSREAAKAVFSSIAVNARTYHKNPLLFQTNEPEALESALSRYCGAAAAVADAGSVDSLRRVTDKYRVEIIGI